MRTVRCLLLGKAQWKTKHVAYTAAGLRVPSRSRTQETCKSPSSLRPDVPVDQLPKICRAEFQKTSSGTFRLPPCLSSSTLAPTVLNRHFGTQGAEQRSTKPLNITTPPSNARFLQPKARLFYGARRRCLLHRFNISLASPPHGE